MSQVQVTISDEEYSELLQVRLAAKHGFEAGTVSQETYNQARAAVRRARKVRRQEGAVVENYRQQSAPQHQAMTRRPHNGAVLIQPVHEAPKMLIAAQADQEGPEDGPVQLVLAPERRVRQVTPEPAAVETPEPEVVTEAKVEEPAEDQPAPEVKKPARRRTRKTAAA